MNKWEITFPDFVLKQGRTIYINAACRKDAIARFCETHAHIEPKKILMVRKVG